MYINKRLSLSIYIHAYMCVCVYICVCAYVCVHWGRVTYICVSDLTNIGSDNGLSPGRCQSIIRTNAGLLLIGPLGTNLSEIIIEILAFSFRKMRLKVSSAKWRPFWLGLNVIYRHIYYEMSPMHMHIYIYHEMSPASLKDVFCSWYLRDKWTPKPFKIDQLWKGRDKMAAVSQTTLSNAFSWMKMLEFRLRFHWSLFLRF